MNKHALLAVTMLSVLIYGAYNMGREPRGIRNNNPGNIRHGDNWQGMSEIQSDIAFIQFDDPVYGIRAMTRIIRNYRARYGFVTVDQIISRWAPPVENNTQAYIESVADKLGIRPQFISTQEVAEHQYPALLKAIIYHENGKQPYSDEQINEGIALA